MIANIVGVPPGGGEAEIQIQVEIPTLPPEGTYLSVKELDSSGTQDFICRRVRMVFGLNSTESTTVDRCDEIVIEAEIALSPLSSSKHRDLCERLKRKECAIQTFEDSAY